MGNKRFKSPLVMFTVLLLANYVAPQAQAGLIAAKGVGPELPGTTVPAQVLGVLPSENFDPEIPPDEWISLSRPAAGGDWNALNRFLDAKGCKDKRSTGGVVCGFLNLGDIIPLPGVAAGAVLAAGAESNSVPVPATLVLFGIGLASLGVSRRRR